MKLDNRTRWTRDIKYCLILIIGILIGGMSFKFDYWNYQQEQWADNQVPMLLSPLGSSVIHAQEAPKPTPTPDPIEVRKQIVRNVFGADSEDAIKVFMCEGLRSNKCNDGLNKNGSFDCGVAQINSIHGVARRFLLNPEINIRIAKQLFDEQGWTPWTCKYVLN